MRHLPFSGGYVRLARFLQGPIFVSLFFVAVGQIYCQVNEDHLANNTVLIIRHAEKPEKGRELTSQGEARARAYVSYFKSFKEEGFSFPVDAIYAGADSDNSIRPRLTLEPLSKATGMTLHTDIGTNNTAALVQELRSDTHGVHPLVAWRHSQIPSLLLAFGASPNDLLPNGKWPDSVYDWVIILSFDGKGHLVTQHLIHEHLKIDGN
jgi:hypothetical protein